MSIRVFALVAAVAATASGSAWPSAAPAAGAVNKAPDPRAWPTAYEHAAITVAELLAGVKRANGAIDTASDTGRISYAYHDGGLDGTQHEIWRGDDYRTDTTIGPFVTADGRYQGQRWETGENGYTLLKRGIHRRSAVNARALEKPEPGDNVSVLGRLRVPADVYVLRVAPKGGREERRFYDVTTFRLVRREMRYLERLVVTTYDDYRTAHGITLAYRTAYSDGHPENDGVLSIRELRIGDPVDEREVVVGNTRRSPVVFPDGVDTVRLPANVDRWGRIIVRLVINGRGLDFQLDSGCSDITLDRDVARQLGVPVYGRWSQTVAGTFTAGKAVIGKIAIGAITMTDTVVSVLPFQFENNSATKVVGLLGFDFIAGGVIKIDYEHGTVDAMRYGYEPPPESLSLDAVLDDNVPMISVSVNGVAADRFILDTGADDAVLFAGFSARHPEAITDHSPGKVLSRAFNVVTSKGVGGELRTRAISLESLKIGSVKFNDFFTLVMTGDQPAFEGEDTDGLIGAGVLSAFDVYLDYANSRVVLVLNDSAKQHRTARGLGSR